MDLYGDDTFIKLMKKVSPYETWRWFSSTPTSRRGRFSWNELYDYFGIHNQFISIDIDLALESTKSNCKTSPAFCWTTSVYRPSNTGSSMGAMSVVVSPNEYSPSFSLPLDFDFYVETRASSPPLTGALMKLLSTVRTLAQTVDCITIHTYSM
jgi:hypothetical protein